MSVSHLTLGLSLVGGDTWLGGVIYVKNLVECLAQLPADERPDVVLKGQTESSPILNDLLAFDFVRRGTTELERKFPKWQHSLSKTRRAAIRILRGEQADPWFRDVDILYPTLSRSRGGRKEVFWIPDFQEVYLPELFSEEEKARRQKRYSAMARKPGVIVFSSEMARDDFKRLFPGAHASARILRFCSVLKPDPLGHDPRQAYGLPEKYIYVANQFWAHKNHMQLLEALRVLKERKIDIPLVCTGLEADYRNPDYMASIRHFVVAHGLASSVRFLGVIPRAEQVQLYRYAAAVLQPSRFEGWSTVIEDARTLGRPLLVSDFPVHREQVPSAKFFPLMNSGALADLLAHEWPKLPPGPDKVAEENALSSARTRQIECARALNSILTEAQNLTGFSRVSAKGLS